MRQGRGRGAGAAGLQSPLPRHWNSPEQQARDDARTVLDGVEFATRLQVSASLGGRDFLACCRELRIDPRSLMPAQRRALDDQMAVHFRQAADAGGVTRLEGAVGWLRGLLTGGRD